MDLLTLNKEIKLCRRCHLSSKCNQVVTGKGDERAKIFILGEAPGQDEDIIGEPFVGRAGKLLDVILDKAGIDREHVFISNSIRCNPTEKKGKFKKNRTPTKDEIQACKHWTWAELKCIEPKIVITLGKIATGLLLDLPSNFTLKSVIGNWCKVNYADFVVVPTLHPSFLLQYGRQELNKTIEIFRKVKQSV